VAIVICNCLRIKDAIEEMEDMPEKCDIDKEKVINALA
jgi:hypothetical protein